MADYQSFLNELKGHGFSVSEFGLSEAEFQAADQGTSKTFAKNGVTITISKPHGVDSFNIYTSQEEQV